MIMAEQVAVAVRSWVRRPAVQDAALASGLLALCVLVNDPYSMVGAMADNPIGGGRSCQVVLWWVATAFAMAAVTLRRRWPMPMLVVCTLSAGAHVAEAVPPMIIDLGVLVLLYTVAARRGRRVSLAVLAGLLLLVTGWTMYYTLNGRPVPGLPTLAFQISHRPDPSTGRGDVTIVDHSGGSNAWSGLPGRLLGGRLRRA
jgi:hypothetical protein